MSEYHDEDRYIGDTGRYPNFNPEQYLQDLNIDFKTHDSEDHQEVAINCPCCKERGEMRDDTKFRCWLNPELGTFYCYNCGWAGLFPKLIRKLSKVQLHDAMRILRGRDLDSLEHMNLKLWDESVDFREEEYELREVEFPFGYEPIEGPHPYLEERGVPWEYAADNEWGICRVGYCKDRLIVPMYMNYRLAFWQARATWKSDEKDFKKVLNPKGVSARHVLYNYDEIVEAYDEIVICEGFFDACKVGPQAVATNGKNLHPQQVEWLRQTNVKRVVLMWDKDAWTDGRTKKPSSIERAADLLKICFDVRAVKMPDERDPGDYPFLSKDLKEMIAGAERV